MKKRLLLVDDYDDFRAIVKDYLGRHNLDLEIFEANSGEMAVIEASCMKPDIILMDISLPNQNGLEAAGQIKETQPDCDIIILTLFDVAVFKQDAQKIKVRSFISKNEVYEKLLPVIKECLSPR